MRWTTTQRVTLTEEPMTVIGCDGFQLACDDFTDVSHATVTVPDGATITHIDEIAPDGLEITFATAHAEVTLVLAGLNELDLHNALDIHLRDMREMI